MAYSLNNKCPKNLCKWTALVQLIFENVVTFFETECTRCNRSNYRHACMMMALPQNQSDTGRGLLSSQLHS